LVHPPLSTRRVLQHLADLWGYDIVLREVEADGEAVRQQYAVGPRQAFL
jgi:spore cortex formation protein SpoVR/YcgB (stage V sporulation)